MGRGGFAEVYLGGHIHLGTQAAIKVLHTQLTTDDMETFRKEARTIAQLEHPHIVRVLDFGVEGKTPFLVMSYAANGTLRQRHPKGSRLPLATVASYVKQLADALQYAHDEKLVHRDVKPENMLVGKRQEILLSDFGIAIIAQSSRYQGSQDMAGTIIYIAPEQIQRKPRPASDQYALGIVVYEWLCGQRPFAGSFVEIAAKHAMTPPPPLREKVPTLPPGVEQVVLTALAKDPKQRFASVQAFANSLEQAYQSGQERSSAPTLLVTTPRPPASPTRETLPSSFAPTPAPPVQPTRETPPAGLAPTRQAAPDKVVEPSAPVVSASESVHMESLFNEGVIAQSNGNLEQALQLFQQVRKQDPNYRKGKLTFQMKKLLQQQVSEASRFNAPEREIKALNELLRLNPNDTSVQKRLEKLSSTRIERLRQQASSARQSSKWDSEYKALEEILKLKPQDIEAQKYIATAKIKYLRQQARNARKAASWDVEASTWRELLVLQPASAEAKRRLAIAMKNQGNCSGPLE